MTSAPTLARILVAAGACLIALAGLARVAVAADTDPGVAVFVEKQCVRCHRPAGEAGMGPSVDELRHPQGEMELAGRLWNHVPAMFVKLESGAQWPRITASEMALLMAYLKADPTRDPAVDLQRGQATLVRKGCLKCHSFRREGGKVQPDLATRRADYESAAVWAAAMWTHTPRMATVAAQQGVPYPRFSGDEMANLLAFLRNATRRSP